ncbi:MAG: hypothetical protein FD163_741 [Hyphomonadaceae bacterium]|nr:MAG: hypothetical protein FD163_741 [Hyphomonadaceae bacterium]
MTICLYDPQFGYYTTRAPIGAKGDFITAPEISQMFGEMIGVWVTSNWYELGEPTAFHLIELGPGRGTLMKDVLRVLEKNPQLCAGLSLKMVETNPHFRAMQAEVVKGFDCQWFDGIEAALLGEAPFILIANEFLDCLPIKQFIKTDTGWHEWQVIIDENDRLNFKFADATQNPPKPVDVEAQVGTIVEIATALPAIIEAISKALRANNGMALFIDYGYFKGETGDSLQALHKHEKVWPLSHIGEADLTAHVDFAVIAETALEQQIEIIGPKTQREFLLEMGVEVRAQALCTANPARENEIKNDLSRLIDHDQMGDLFKAIVLKFTKVL